MSNKNKNNRGGMVYSTNPDFDFSSQEEEKDMIPPEKQDLRVWLQKLGGNKVASVVKGYVGKTGDLEDLARVLKSKCGVGGSAKDGEIIIQGDHREKIVDILTKAGYKAKKAGG